MYMILDWQDDDSFLTHIENENGSIKLFSKFSEAEFCISEQKNKDDLRIVSIEKA